MSDDFRDRMLAATRVLRSRESELRRQIGAIYRECANRMEQDIRRYGEDSLTGRRAAALQKSMRRYVKQIWRDVEKITTQAARDGVGIGVGIQTSLLDDAIHGIGLSARASFQGAFGRTADEAVAAVLNGGIYKGKRASLSKRIWNNEALQGGQIEQLIARAAAEGRSAVQLAKDLQAYVNPQAAMPTTWNEIYPMPFIYKTDYNAQRLAVTSLNHAYYQGMIMAARENPYAEYLHWELSSFHLIYDVCDLYMEHDEGLGLGNFALDSPDLPLPHPFCRCNYYVDSSMSLKEIGEEIGAWVGGEENPKLDTAFAEWKKEQPSLFSTGAKKTFGWKDRHAERYYEEVRHRSPGVDAKRIAKHIDDFTEEQLEDIRQHMFIREHPLDNGQVIGRFAEDYDQAVAWQRLTEGKGTDIDVLMLKHEYLELTQMRLHGYNYDKAHNIANQTYNWWDALCQLGKEE